MKQAGKVEASLGNKMIYKLPPKKRWVQSPAETLSHHHSPWLTSSKGKKRARAVSPGTLFLTLPSVQAQPLLQPLWKKKIYRKAVQRMPSYRSQGIFKCLIPMLVGAWKEQE